MPVQHGLNRRLVLSEPRTGKVNCCTSTCSEGDWQTCWAVWGQSVQC